MKKLNKIIGSFLFIIGMVLIFNSFSGMTGFVVAESIGRHVSSILGFVLIIGGGVLFMIGRLEGIVGKKDEVYMMKSRDYQLYLEMFGLPEKFLEGKKILDIGAGLANFAEKANEKLKDKSTQVYAADINYDILGEDNFVEEIEKRGKHSHLEEQREEFEVRRKSLLKKVKEQKIFVAADRRALPFKKGSFDLILFNNSICLHPGRFQNKYNPLYEKIFRESLEALKKNGQIRITPSPISYKSYTGHHNELVLPNDIKYHPISGEPRLVKGNMINRFRKLEREGFRIYLIDRKARDSKYWETRDLIITKKEHKFSEDEIKSYKYKRSKGIFNILPGDEEWEVVKDVDTRVLKPNFDKIDKDFSIESDIVFETKSY